MDTWKIIATLFAGIGIGTIVSTAINTNFMQKKLIFETKLTKYSNLIQAYQECVAKNRDEVARQNYVSCQKQVELIGSRQILELSNKIYNSNDTKIRDALVNAMREDLKYDYNNSFLKNFCSKRNRL
jgi:hypothetical protein